MMAYRLQAIGATSIAIRGNGYALPFPSDSFDDIVSIGCLHHTGQLQLCITEVHRVLKPGGRAVIMLYNQFSYRQWLRSPLRTVAAMAGEMAGRAIEHPATERQRRHYDIDSKGRAAPETVFVSQRGIRRLFHEFSTVDTHKENCDDVIPAGGRLSLRRWLLGPLGRRAGLDLYVEARK
jgi:ubiquinone/menaquinone biosynthesis C-methylase UbiE